MNHEIRFELTPADVRNFSGEAFTRLMGAADSSTAVKLYYVRFEPRARTFWHAHQGRQVLVVTAGRCRYQIEGGAILELVEGQSISFEEGVRHWHGAAEDEAAEHIAINLAVGETLWYEEVVLPGEGGRAL